MIYARHRKILVMAYIDVAATSFSVEIIHQGDGTIVIFKSSFIYLSEKIYITSFKIGKNLDGGKKKRQREEARDNFVARQGGRQAVVTPQA